MPCGGFDLHSPFLFAAGAGFFLGAAVSSLVRSFLVRGKRRSRTLVGLYLYLSVFFAVLLVGLLLVDLTVIDFSRLHALVAGVALLFGAAAASWKKIAGGVLLVLLFAVFTVLSLFVEGRSCAEAEKPLLELQVLSVREDSVELEVLEAAGNFKGHLEIGFAEGEKSDGDGGAAERRVGFSLVYSRTEFADWMFYPRSRYLFRVEDIRAFPDNGEYDDETAGEASGDGGDEYSGEAGGPLDSPVSGFSSFELTLLERIIRAAPFASYEMREYEIPNPVELTRLRFTIDNGRIGVKKIY